MLTQDSWRRRDWLCDGHVSQVKNNGSPAWDLANPLSSGLEQQPGLGAKHPPPGESLYLKMKLTANSRAEGTDHRPRAELELWDPGSPNSIHPLNFPGTQANNMPFIKQQRCLNKPKGS